MQKELIKLDHKVKSGEDLSKEELEFLYEVNRPIETLDSYLARDPRIYSLKDEYGIERTLKAGLEPSQIIKKLGTKQVADNLDLLLKHGADIDF